MKDKNAASQRRGRAVSFETGVHDGEEGLCLEVQGVFGEAVLLLDMKDYEVAAFLLLGEESGEE